MIKSSISSGLPYAGDSPGSLSKCDPNQCGIWFSSIDVYMRVIIGVIRAAQLIEFLAPPCFGTNPDVPIRTCTGEEEPASNARESLRSASAKCNKANLEVPEDLSKECKTQNQKYYLESGKLETCPEA